MYPTIINSRTRTRTALASASESHGMEHHLTYQQMVALQQVER